MLNNTTDLALLNAPDDLFKKNILNVLGTLQKFNTTTDQGIVNQAKVVNTGNTSQIDSTYTDLARRLNEVSIKLNDLMISLDNRFTDNTYAGTVNVLANNAVNLANISQASADAAQATANTASINASSALTQISNIVSDNILSPVEKSAIIIDVNTITSEQAGIDSQAVLYSIIAERTAYDNAITALNGYLLTLTTPVAWNILSGDTTIVGTTFRQKFQDVYNTRQALLNAIATQAQNLATLAKSTGDLALVTANSKNTTFKQATTPTAARVGDIWYKTDNNNNIYWWDGTTWVDTTGDVALAINNNTTTVNGSKITTGSILADKLFVSSLSAITANLGNITAGILNSITINSGTLNAVTINASTINSSTMNIRDLNTINDAAYSVYPIFTALVSTSWNAVGSNPSVQTISTDIYPYNSTNTSKKKLVGATMTTPLFGTSPNNLPAKTDGLFLTFQSGSAFQTFVEILAGTAQLGAFTFTAGNVTAGVQTVKGFTFEYYLSGGSYYFSMGITPTPNNISNTGANNPISIRLTYTWSGSMTGYNPLAWMMVSNL